MKPFLKEKTLPLVWNMFFADSGFVLCMVCGLLSGWGLLGGPFRTVMAAYSVASLLADAYFAGFVHWSVVADGATDNMTGCLTAMSILQEMAEKDQRFQHTDVSCLLTSGEETGLRGARAFAKKHREALQNPHTVVIAIDTLREADQLMVYPRGINGLQQNSPAVCALLRRAGESCGVPVADAGPFPGGTDAEAFSREGIQAASLCGMSHAPSRFYHTRYDRADILDPKAIGDARRLVAAAVALWDREG